MKDYKPLLVVKMPIGRMTTKVMREQMQIYREQFVESYEDQYNIALVGTTEKEWGFDGFFANTEQIETIKKQAEEKTKEIMEGLKNEK